MQGMLTQNMNQNVRKNYGPERRRIYEYLESQGFEITPERHERIRALIQECVNIRTAYYQRELMRLNNLRSAGIRI